MGVTGWLSYLLRLHARLDLLYFLHVFLTMKLYFLYWNQMQPLRVQKKSDNK